MDLTLQTDFVCYVLLNRNLILLPRFKRKC